METICKTPAQAAKRIRLELKDAFPGIKFSVRTKVYSMGNSIDISWTNGPTDKAVDAIVKKYEYGRFDGMTDSSSVEMTVVSLPNGEVANLGGAKHVFTHREISEDIIDRAQVDVCGLNSVEFKGSDTPVLGNNGKAEFNAGQLAYRILRASDLSQGYNGLRLAKRDADGLSFAERVTVIPEGEVAAPVAPAPIAAPAAFGEDVLAASLEIITHFGPSIQRMRTEARRASVAHRCYIRYPALDRELVQRAVLTVLVCELTT